MEENEVGNLGILLTEIDHEPFFFWFQFPPAASYFLGAWPCGAWRGSLCPAGRADGNHTLGKIQYVRSLQNHHFNPWKWMAYRVPQTGFFKWLPTKLSWRRQFSIFLGTETSYFQPQGGEASPASPTETEGSTQRREKWNGFSWCFVYPQ